MITAIVFDLGGVYFTDGTDITVRAISEQYGITSDRVAMLLKTSNPTANVYRRGAIAADEFWDSFKEQLGIHTENKDLTERWAESYKPIQGTVAIIRKLKEKGMRLYFLSDNVKERADYLQEKYRFLGDFAGGIFSHMVHKTKRDGTAVFKLAVELTKEKPGSILYVDDKEAYVESAKKVGMRGIVFKNPKQLQADLEARGIL